MPLPNFEPFQLLRYHLRWRLQISETDSLAISGALNSFMVHYRMGHLASQTPPCPLLKKLAALTVANPKSTVSPRWSGLLREKLTLGMISLSESFCSF